MKLGLPSDVHEDLARLQWTLDVFRGEHVEQLVFLGDVTLMGEQLEETCRMLQDAGVVGVWGNHDLGLSNDPSPVVRTKYGEAVIRFMTSLRPWLDMDECHFSHVEPWLDPHDPSQINYYEGPPDEPAKLARIFGAVPQRLIFGGHYHGWLLATPHETLPWSGEHPIRLSDGRYFAVVGAVCEGLCATLDTRTWEPDAAQPTVTARRRTTDGSRLSISQWRPYAVRATLRVGVSVAATFVWGTAGNASTARLDPACPSAVYWGNLTRRIDRNGRTNQFAYDELNRPASEQWREDASPAPSISIATTTQGGATSEVQRVGFTAMMITGGTFTLTHSGQTTSNLAWNASAADVKSALEALSGVGSGNVAVTKLSSATNHQEWQVTFQGSWPLAGKSLRPWTSLRPRATSSIGVSLAPSTRRTRSTWKMPRLSGTSWMTRAASSPWTAASSFLVSMTTRRTNKCWIDCAGSSEAN